MTLRREWGADAWPGVRLEIHVGSSFADLGKMEADVAVRPTTCGSS